MGTNETILLKGKGNHGLDLSDYEKQALVTFLNKYTTKTEAAAIIGIDRNVLDRVLLAGSGSVKTIKKVRKAIKKVEVPEEMDRPE